MLAAELYAIFKAVVLYVKSNMNEIDNIVIFTDSKTATSLIVSPTGSYTQLVRNIQQELSQINSISTRVRIQWIRAHCGIKGNEIADEAAKMAHNNNSVEELWYSYEEMLGLLKVGLKQRWNENWQRKVNETKIGEHTLGIFKSVNNVMHIKENNRRICVVINRLQLGHVGVKSYLHRFNMSDTSLCSKCKTPETIEHFLLVCSLYSKERLELMRALFNEKIYQITLETLLGGGNFNLKTKQFIRRTLIKFLRSTGRKDDL